MSFIGTLLRMYTERSAKGKSYADLIQSLEQDAAASRRRFDQATDTPANRKQAGHVIGIEAWGQRRLRVALGEPFVQDEYDPYMPSPELNMQQLAQLYSETRAETVALVHKLQAANVPVDQKVKHNDMGEITLGAWLSYIAGHGGMEAKRLKAA
jgi:hypothetical protein